LFNNISKPMKQKKMLRIKMMNQFIHLMKLRLMKREIQL